MNEILKEDFDGLLQYYDFSALKGRSVFITGATGLIGSQVLKFLNYLNESQGFDMRLYALIRSEEKALRVFGSLYTDKKISFFNGNVLGLPPVYVPIDYIIHGASVTSSQDFVTSPVETIETAVNGTGNVLKFAREKRVKSFLYLSSMETFGITDGKGEVREPDLGYIDVLSPRSSYSESKRLCECLCASYAQEYGINAKIIRLTQTLGAGIAYDDSRVAAQFARAVIEEKDIVLKTKGATKRPVIYTSDAVSAMLTVLLKGNPGEAYTAANPETFMTIRETAEMVAGKIAEGRIKVIFDIQGIPLEYAPNLNLNLNVDKLRSLGWSPRVGLEEAYRRMIAGMRV